MYRSPLVVASVATMFLLQLCYGEKASLEKGADAWNLCEQIILKMGYPCQNYTVETGDGFLLGLYRMPYGFNEQLRDNSWSRPPVFLQHGLLQGGDNWVLNNPDESLAYILADAGFDVWIGNIRGTRWSHGHISLNTRDKNYWDWSIDELAAYDLPAMLEFVYKSTGRKTFYVGHSQGTIIGFAAFTQDRVGDFVAAAALLSPITYLNHINCAFCNIAAHYYVERMVKTMGIREFNLRNELGVELVDRVCASPKVDCENLLASITGANCCFNSTRIPYYTQYEPHSTSLKNLAHLAQMVRQGTFEMYDYGKLGNLLRYFRFSPPAYDLSKIPKSLPIWMSWGGNDALADPVDVAHTMEELPSKPELVYVEDYGHIDFILSTRAKADVYDSLVAFFRAQLGNVHADT
ncbi:hypothetical protein R1sor_012889 [Riccia sorocarpa]|uniref:Lipase n=1 Tax=Riccia sorocarpa TaxID=122646 RepID=A0ABD3I5E8_9MARC